MKTTNSRRYARVSQATRNQGPKRLLMKLRKTEESSCRNSSLPNANTKRSIDNHLLIMDAIPPSARMKISKLPPSFDRDEYILFGLAIAEKVGYLILRETGNLKDEISQREAHRLFGSGNVQSLLNRGLIKRVVGKSERSKITYSRSEIDAALKLNRMSLL